MATQREMQKQSQERQRWAACDPVTLVAAARQTIYADSERIADSSEVRGPLEEVISRFEQQTRAALGSATLVGSSPTPAPQ